MCEQCSAKTLMYITDGPTPPIAGAYWLVRATQDGNDMKKDDWGLITCNDPDFIFTTTPWPNPFYHMTPDELEVLDVINDKTFERIQDKWYMDVEKFATEMAQNQKNYWSINAFGELTINCLDAGMPKRDVRLAHWLFQHIGEQLQAHPDAIPDKHPEPEEMVETKT